MLVRQAARAAVVVVLVAVVLSSTGRGQPAAQPDRVYIRDKDGSERSIVGELKAGPTGYQVVGDGKSVPVAPADILRVLPGQVAGVDKTDLDTATKFETAKDWEKARAGYAGVLTKASGAPEKTRRYLEFKTATLSARAADEVPDDGAAQAKAEEAAKLLEQFLNAYKTGWEVWPVAQTCARLQVSLTKKDGDKEGPRAFDEAARTWGKVAKNADVPTDLRLAAGLQEVDDYLRARRYAEARTALDETEKSAAAGAGKDRLAIYRQGLKVAEGGQVDGAKAVEAAKAIEADIAKTKDPVVRATGYGMLGELYLTADKPREAMWAFLWVEAVYNQDKDEVLKAMVRLSDAFRLQGDEDRAKTYRDKARRFRAGL